MTTLDENYWDSRYEEGQIGWDLGAVSPPLKKYIDGLAAKDIRILIPGAGNAYEWRYLVNKGFTNSEVVDFADSPLNELKIEYPSYQSKIRHQDFFTLDPALTYDLILEQTFFCALSPEWRPKYVTKVFDLLADNGLLVGVLFDRHFEKAGPPFGGELEEYRELFSTHFHISTMQRCTNSVLPRQGHELFIILRKKSITDHV